MDKIISRDRLEQIRQYAESIERVYHDDEIIKPNPDIETAQCTGRYVASYIAGSKENPKALLQELLAALE